MSVPHAVPPAAPPHGSGFWPFLFREMRPKGKLLTPFNLISINSRLRPNISASVGQAAIHRVQVPQ